jgi:hypothetical protein
MSKQRWQIVCDEDGKIPRNQAKVLFDNIVFSEKRGIKRNQFRYNIRRSAMDQKRIFESYLNKGLIPFSLTIEWDYVQSKKKLVPLVFWKQCALK